ncbi:unnamed protein product [Rotaria socialis]|uniref:Uncharacterized protein n=1 Tax=Rotaria socialis TaxID=392032 RepID=A0A818B588_9BILA|nr:unnamed protein product [Rotaria socialis]CAF3443590.1 unnamed protein product [Rotaria socialis]
MTLNTTKSHERISIKHSTIDPVYLLSDIAEKKHNNKSLFGTSDFVNFQISRIDNDSARDSLNDRHDDSKGDITPGPGAYVPENTMRAAYKSSPAYSFGLRYKYPELSESLGPAISQTHVIWPNHRNRSILWLPGVT